MTNLALTAGLIAIPSALSSEYYETQDGSTHVYLHGDRWIVARVSNGTAWSSRTYPTLADAVAGV